MLNQSGDAMCIIKTVKEPAVSTLMAFWILFISFYFYSIYWFTNCLHLDRDRLLWIVIIFEAFV